MRRCGGFEYERWVIGEKKGISRLQKLNIFHASAGCFARLNRKVVAVETMLIASITLGALGLGFF